MQRRFLLVVFICLVPWTSTLRPKENIKRIPRQAERKAESTPDFPNFESQTYEAFHSRVEVKDGLEKDVNSIMYVEEFYIFDEGEGRMDLLQDGEAMRVLYYKDTKQTLTIIEKDCLVLNLDESPYDAVGMMYGWVNKTNLMIGPSALFLNAFGNPKNKYIGEEHVRDIQCSRWTLNDGDVTVDYYFTVKDWTGPYNKVMVEQLVPVRVHVTGKFKKPDADQPTDINQVMDYVYFRPYEAEGNIFEPPSGIGCEGKKDPLPTRKVPDSYSLVGEEYVTDSENPETSIINVKKIWFTTNPPLTRIDNSAEETSILSEFKAGVSYTITKNRDCTIGPIQGNMFESFSYGVVGQLKNPLDILRKTDEFYYLGKQHHRGIDCDVWETVQYKVEFQGYELYRAVYTFFFTKDKWEVVNDGAVESQVPIGLTVTGYNKDGKNIYLNKINIFNYLEYSELEMLNSFHVESCFPDPSQRNYYSILFKAKGEASDLAKAKSIAVRNVLLQTIGQYSQVSIPRLPYLTMTYFSGQGFRATGLMLERAPYLASFMLMNEKDKPKKLEKKYEGKADIDEDCAKACTASPDCKGFHFCGKGVCYLSNISPNKTWGLPIGDQECALYIRSEINSSAAQPSLKEGIAKLTKAIKDNKFILHTGDMDITASDFVPDVGIFDRPAVVGLPFPDLEKIIFESFASQVEVTDRIKNKTVYFEEYFDDANDAGVLKLLESGSLTSLYYYSDTNEYLSINNNTCTVYPLEIGDIFAYSDYYGFYNNNKTLLMGPSALLRNAFGMELRFQNKHNIRGIDCLLWTAKKDNLTISYYFTMSDWTNPFGLEDETTPVRVVVVGTAKDVNKKDVKLNHVIDYVTFQPYVSDWRVFQPPVGMGCPGKTAVKTERKFPEQYSFIAEEYSDLDDHLTTYVNVFKMWYDAMGNITRIDSWTDNTKELSDYNNGVTYVIANGSSCSIELLRNKFADLVGEAVSSKIKNPLSVIGLKTDYYSLGQQSYRGITCDVWESVKENVQLGGVTYQSVVFTLYTTSALWEMVTDGMTEEGVPARVLITGYTEPGKVGFKKDINLFRFLNISEIDEFSTFDVERCFPDSSQKAYFRLSITGTPEAINRAREKDYATKMVFQQEVAESASVSLLRVPYLTLSYTSKGVDAVGLMLGKPSLGSFSLMDKTYPKKSEKPYIAVRDKEDCARLCLQDNSCTAFHFCGTSKDCFLSDKSVFDDWGEDVSKEQCDLFYRSHSKSSIEPPLKEALDNLKNNIKKEPIEFGVDEGLVTLSVTDVKVNVTIDENGEGPPFPNLTSLVYGSFQTHVEVADKDMKGTYFVEEYVDVIQDMGHLSILQNGEKTLFYYYNETRQIVSINTTEKTCSVVDMSVLDEASDFIFGWIYEYTSIFLGPSALLFRGIEQRDKIKYTGPAIVRGTACSSYLLQDGDIDITYYFTVPGWTDPYEKYVSIRPTRVKVDGSYSKRLAKVTIHEMYDFIFFQPFTEEESFQLPIGVGCNDMKGDLTIPTLPNEFYLGAEEYFIDQDKLETSINLNLVWYDNSEKMGRFDMYVGSKEMSTLGDFNTGVQYVITDQRVCEILPLQSNFQNKKDGASYIKSSNELFGLSGNVYFLGKAYTRGIECGVWETVKNDVVIDGTKYYKVVMTYYFTWSDWEVITDGDFAENVLVRLLSTFYKDFGQPGFTKEWNIFGFENSPANFYSDFKIEMCFPEPTQKSYFMISFEAEKEWVKAAQDQSTLFRTAVIASIKNSTDISTLRIPFLRVDYLDIMITVTGLLLERPPYLVSFQKSGTGAPGTSAVKVTDTVEDRGDCAKACLDNNRCKGFHFCGKDDCYLALLGKVSGTTMSGKDSCEKYDRNDMNSTDTDIPLVEALIKLQVAVDDKTLTVPFFVNNDEVLFTPFDAIIGEDPFSRDKNELYEVTLSGYEIDNPDDLEVAALEVEDARYEEECYRRCQDTAALNCASFSFCMDSGRCRLTSQLLTKQSDIVTTAPKCSVFTRSYLELFDKYPGKVSLVGGDSTPKVESAKECARACKEEKSGCLAFEFCESKKICTLHKKHTLDMKPGDLKDTTPDCAHYSAKFSADYREHGRTLIGDTPNSEMDSVSLEECARVCSEQSMTSCKSFDYCPGPKTNPSLSTCSLFSITLGDAKDVSQKGTCRHYEKREALPNKDERDERGGKESGYTPGGLAGLLIGMILFGAVIGGAAFQGYNHYRFKKSGADTTVKFNKHQDDQITLE